jgi:CBS domain-containing protein
LYPLAERSKSVPIRSGARDRVDDGCGLKGTGEELTMKPQPMTPGQFLPYKSLKQILAAKLPGVHSVAPDTPIFRALQLMAEKDVGAVVVLEAEKIVGIFSERDYARKVVLVGKTSKDTPVREIMTTNVICITLEDDAPHCMTLMTEKRIRHLPVVDGDRLIGLVSIGDIVKEVLAHHEHIIHDLALERLTILNQPSGY